MKIEFDETFWELCMEDIKDGIEKVARSRAKRPKPHTYTIWTPTRTILITIEAP